MAKKLLITLICISLLAASVVFANASVTSKAPTGTDTAYTNAAQQLDTKYGYDGTDLGATYSKEGTTFKVWAPTATDVKLNLYATGSDSEQGAKKISTTALTFNSSTGIWSTTLAGDHKNKYYTYTITAKNVTGSKTTTKETQDVYSIATGVNGNRSQIIDLKDTNPEGWENDKHVVPDKVTDSFVWEVHVRDFSNSPTSGVSAKNRGKYTAFTETGTTLNNEGKVPTMVDYLKQLGVTTVQINPFYDFSSGSVDETNPDAQFNWGYDPVNYNVPEGAYSTNPYDGNVRIKECKQMIQALHNAGISVVMDVVYNHVADVKTNCLEATVPNYYFRMKADGTFSDGSGCGNETASERRMYRNYMIQSCLYWVNEYHIDGFRFDLMAIHDVETLNLLRTEMDKIDPRLTLWGEGWTGGDCNYPSKTWNGSTFIAADRNNAKDISERIAFFSDGVRDGLKGSVFDLTGKGWVQGDTGSVSDVINGVLANTKGGRWSVKQPSQIVTYASCHDNQTLWDRLAASQGVKSNFRQRNETFVAQNKLVAGMLNMSQGITFVLAGEEMGRSKDNDENSYKSSATLNQIDWSLASSNADIVDYYKGVRQIREKFSPLRDDTNNSASGYNEYTKLGSSAVLNVSQINAGNVCWFAWTWNNSNDGRWVAAQGTDPASLKLNGLSPNLAIVALDPAKCNNGTAPTWDAKLAQTGDLTLDGGTFTVTRFQSGASSGGIDGNWSGSSGSSSSPNVYAGVWTNNTSGEWKKLAVIANNSSSSTTYTIDSSEGTEWVILANSKSAGVKNLGTVTNGTVTVDAYSMIIAVDKASFEGVVDNPTTEPTTAQPTTEPTTAEPTTEPTTAEPTTEPPTIESTEPTTDAPATAPQPLKGDVNRDGKVNITDVTLIQKYLAKLIPFDDEQLSLAEFDGDGRLCIKDATAIQYATLSLNS